MMKTKARLSLYRPALYQVKIPGALNEHWSDWEGEMEVTFEKDEDGFQITILTGILDQAALLGLLRQIYSLGLPLISVNWIPGD